MNGKSKDDAIKEALDRLARAGRLTPKAVIEAAKAPDSPLHECFLWDDKAAAARYRVIQARRLISSLEISIIENTREVFAPYAVRDPLMAAKQQGYSRTVDLQTDQARARMALRNEVGKVVALMGRVRALSIALNLEGEVSRIQAEVDQLADRIAA